MPQLALIFDLDGTLLDSTHVWHEIDQVFLGKRGLAVPPDYVPAIASMNLAQAAAYTKSRFSFPESEEAIIAEWHRMVHHAYECDIPMKPGADAVLHRFAEQGIPIALATASDPAYYVPALKRCGVYDCFSCFVHSRPELPKGNAAFYLHCAEKLGIRPEKCVVFEDVLPGILAAKDAGMCAIAVADSGNADDRETLLRHADFFLPHWAALRMHPRFAPYLE